MSQRQIITSLIFHGLILFNLILYGFYPNFYTHGFSWMTGGTSSPTLLYVACYTGQVTTLSLHQHQDGGYDLSEVSRRSDSTASSPSCLALDDEHLTVFLVNEALKSPEGSLSSWKIDSNGALKEIDRVDTIPGGVSAAISGSSLSTFSVGTDNRLSPLQTLTFTLPHPGPNPARQEAPHPHDVILDPTGRYLLVPDLGADLLRVFSIAETTNEMLERVAFPAKPGTGPRHALFWKPDGQESTFLYVVTELDNSVTGYLVEYLQDGELSLQEISRSSTYGPKSAAPKGALAAEVALVGEHLYVSNRYDGTFTTPQGRASDSIATFALSATTGRLEFQRLSPAYGTAPRHFSFNAAGSKLAVAVFQSHHAGSSPLVPKGRQRGFLQRVLGRDDGGISDPSQVEGENGGQDEVGEEASVVLIARDVSTGALGLDGPVAEIGLGSKGDGGQATWVLWDE
ncbi:MAG: hypothetical protein M1838_001157 [Thelocarpon superellum]|nr:MAG: hypothetical protein M1838_001157 [Thelocarpon superellum]